MFCGQCGTNNPDTNQFCKNCGKPLRKTPAATQPAPAPSPRAAVPNPSSAEAGAGAPIQPAVPVPASQAQGGAPVPPAVELAVKPARNWLAIVSVIVSLASWLVYPILLGFIAIVLGVATIYTAKKNQAKIPVSAIIAIIIGLLAIVINFFWIDLFPAPAVLPPIN